MDKLLKDREIIEIDFRKMLSEMLHNFFDKEWQEKHMTNATGKIKEMTDNKGSTNEVIGNLAKLGMAYVALTMEEVMLRATQDMEGNGGET